MLSIPLLALAIAVQDTIPRVVPADTFADSATAALVAGARAARVRNEALVTAYSAQVSQRLGIGVRGITRDRMLYRQELVADIEWRRDSISTITAVGAREAVPVADAADRVPEDLRQDLRSLVFDPASDNLHLIGTSEASNEGFLYPLAAGAEQFYRYALGNTTTIGLAGGRQVRLVALEVTAREATFRHVNGTFWFDADNFALVRAAFRPGRPWEMRLDTEEGGELPLINPKGMVNFVSVEYSLHDARWWMPRLVAIEASGQIGSWLDAPFRIERRYSRYQVTGGEPPDSLSDFIPAGRRGDYSRRNRERGDTIHDPADSNLAVIIPADSAALINSAELGEPILAIGDLISESELARLGEAIATIPDAPLRNHLELPNGVTALLRNARYNRVEGLSLGASALFDAGRYQARALTRIGLADGEPRGELTAARLHGETGIALTAYRRLAVANPDVRPHSGVASLNALLIARDDGEYFRATGVELNIGSTRVGGWSSRIWYQSERAAERNTHASLPNLFDDHHRFRPNITAQRADQFGASLSLAARRALSQAVTLGLSSEVDAATGDFDFARAAVTLRATAGEVGPMSLGLAAAAGTSTGDVPVQSRFYLGGNPTLRGFDGGAASGDSFWRLRAELGGNRPAFRVIAFGDLGWAGSRGDFGGGDPLASVGVGLSLLDGLVRLDLARAVSGGDGTRFEVSFDGLL